MDCSEMDCKDLTPQRQRGRPAGRYGEYRKVRIGADPEIELHKKANFTQRTTFLAGSTPLLAWMGAVQPVNSGRV
jgi:hypothetical protein